MFVSKCVRWESYVAHMASSAFVRGGFNRTSTPPQPTLSQPEAAVKITTIARNFLRMGPSVQGQLEASKASAALSGGKLRTRCRTILVAAAKCSRATTVRRIR